MTGRIHRFDALDNFRDYGDYATAAGRHVAPGRLYRSGHQARASEADLERLGALGIATGYWLAPLLTMLNSCSQGMAVVNIDNGFGAGSLASIINRQ